MTPIGPKTSHPHPRHTETRLNAGGGRLWKESRPRRPARSVRTSGSTWSIGGSMFGGSDETVTIPTILAALGLSITPVVAALPSRFDRSDEPAGIAITADHRGH